MNTPQTGRVGAVIVLAAGGGTRMKSSRSKLLHEVAGRPMLAYALRAASAVQPEHIMVVVGHQREQVEAALSELAPQARTAVQSEQLGTGHAVRCAMEQLEGVSGSIVVTYADVPLLAGETLTALVEEQQRSGNRMTVLTAMLDNPAGYGRIVRGEDGSIERIVEQRDATSEEQMLREVNSGIYVFDADLLREGLASLTTDNDQREYLLTDVVGFAARRGDQVGGFVCTDPWQTEGVNDRVQLAAMSREMNRRIVERWMRAGVTVIDPATTWVEDTVDLAPDVSLLPNTMLQGATSVAAGASVGPDCTLKDVEIDEGATVIRCTGSLAQIGPGANVGPYAYLRPGTVLGAKGKIGTFVETKNAQIGDGAKVPHLCYCGDAVVESGANVGAGTIFANYDGEKKWHTHIGQNGFIGSNSVLVAPVDVGAGAYVAAGSTVAEDVPPGSLGIARGQQHNSLGWVAKRKPGSKFDQAAQSSDGMIHPNVSADRAKQQAAETSAAATVEEPGK